MKVYFLVCLEDGRPVTVRKFDDPKSAELAKDIYSELTGEIYEIRVFEFKD